MWRILANFTRLEKILVIFLTGVIILTSLNLTWVFYQENTAVLPAEGGIYAEGIVGEFKLINPVFANQNPVDADLVKLIFAGLMKYDSEQNAIVDDVAEHTLSRDQKTYTFTIKENAYFHDGEKVTADDVYFTFHDVIQNSQFKNELLRREFEGIEISKVDNKTITFTLPRPYKFFLTNLTIGILPKHLLFDLPLENLDQSTFNQNPIGAGPFKFGQIVMNTNSVDITLKRFENYHGQKPALDGLVLKTYQDYQTLIKNLDVLNGVRAIPKDQVATFPTQNKFVTKEYYLPQYIALFLNNSSPILKDQKVRLALQLATDKQKIADSQVEPMIIDDPLMEIDQKNWIYQYDLKKAAGGLFDTGWKLPPKNSTKEVPVQNQEKQTENKPATTGYLQDIFIVPQARAEGNFITEPNGGVDYKTSEASFYITGNTPSGTQQIIVNNYTLKLFDPAKGTWSYKADNAIGTLKEGENLYTIYAVDAAGVKNKIDEIKITFTKVEKPVENEPEVKPKETVEPVVEPIKVEEKTLQTATGAKTEKVKIEEKKSEEKKEPVKENLPKTATGTNIEEIKPVVKKADPNIRQNSKGEPLTLKLVTSSRPDFYRDIAEEIKKQWLEVGVNLEIEVLDMDVFQSKVLKRDYDVLLYGQSLGYNLDTYSYWHSSQIGEKGLNLANYASFASDSLMEEIRMTHDEDSRNDALQSLKKMMSGDVPAIFLYRPVYYLAYDKRLKKIDFNNLPTISDRFANVEKWHLKEDRFFNPDKSWKSIFSWIKQTAWKWN